MKRGNLNQKLIHELEAGGSGRRKIADGLIPGFTAALANGRVRFIYRYRSPVTGERRDMPIGVYGAFTVEEARAVARKHANTVAMGRDPWAERHAVKKAETVIKHRRRERCSIQREMRGLRHELRTLTATVQRLEETLNSLARKETR
jgi:hypothetical protein